MRQTGHAASQIVRFQPPDRLLTLAPTLRMWPRMWLVSPAISCRVAWRVNPQVFREAICAAEPPTVRAFRRLPRCSGVGSRESVARTVLLGIVAVKDAGITEDAAIEGVGRMPPTTSSSAHPITTLSKIQAVILLRWVLIIATSYLVLFSRPLWETPTSVALFVAVYLASNIVLTMLVPRFPSQYAFDVTVVLLDTLAVCVGLTLTRSASSEFFVVYFVVMFLSALTERLGLVVGAAVLISAAHLYTMSRFVGFSHLVDQGYTLRLPFLFVVALFFGHLVQDARGREREAEEARARELRMEFLATVSHDLKNPLGTIQSLAVLLLDGDAGALNGPQTDLVRRIHANTRQIITVALNIIDAARIEAGRLILQRAPTKLTDVVEDALVLMRSASELKGITLRCAVDPDLPVAYIDAVQIERVISNLVGNAIKFTPAGGTVALSIRREGAEGLLEVCDDGPGIPSSELSTLFEKYRRQEQNSRIEGSGFGLFIVKAIVEAHGGTVAISSTVGQGTTVTVHLPISPPSPERVNGSNGGPPQRLLEIDAPAGSALT